jgi:uncharacterized protein (DUF1810 family)
VLGPRLRACAGALLSLPVPDAGQVLGPVDGQKLRSSMTLFALAAPQEAVFRDVLAAYFSGGLDEATRSRVAGGRRPSESGA